MSEPYTHQPIPQPDPEPEPYHELEPARCPTCFVILRRVSLDAWRCTEHGVVRPWYGKPMLPPIRTDLHGWDKP